jgi:hypothetical protein
VSVKLSDVIVHISIYNSVRKQILTEFNLLSKKTYYNTKIKPYILGWVGSILYYKLLAHLGREG